MYSLNRHNVPEAEPLEHGEPESAHRAGGIDERIASRVAVLCGIRKLPAAYAVQNYENDLLRGESDTG
jgi:hypothetical protein